MQETGDKHMYSGSSPSQVGQSDQVVAWNIDLDMEPPVMPRVLACNDGRYVAWLDVFCALQPCCETSRNLFL